MADPPTPRLGFTLPTVGMDRDTSGMPAQFAMLAVLVGAMMGGLLLVIDREARHREAVYAPLLATCLRVMEAPR